MTRWIEATVDTLRCEGGGHATARITFIGDTDMVTAGLASLSSLSANEIVVAEMDANEIRDESGGLFQSRINNLLGRDDLRFVRLRRVETTGVPTGTSFQAFQQTYAPPRLIFACPRCGSDATATGKKSPSSYRSDGGRLTMTVDLELRP